MKEINNKIDTIKFPNGSEIRFNPEIGKLKGGCTYIRSISNFIVNTDNTFFIVIGISVAIGLIMFFCFLTSVL